MRLKTLCQQFVREEKTLAGARHLVENHFVDATFRRIRQYVDATYRRLRQSVEISSNNVEISSTIKSKSDTNNVTSYQTLFRIL